MMLGMNLLLQAADECSDGTSSISSSSAASNNTDHAQILNSSFASSPKSLHPKKIISSCSINSLPPKKRIKLELSASNGYGMNESFQFPSDTSRMNESFQLGSDTSGISSVASASDWKKDWKKECRNLKLFKRSAIVPTTRSAKIKRGRNSSSKTSSRKRKVSDASTDSIKDVNGNDMCMGYFSMSSHTSSSTKVQNSPAAVTLQDVANVEDQGHSCAKKEAVVPPSTRSNDVEILAGIDSEDSSASIDAMLLLYAAHIQALNRSTCV
eukprot:CAMPEP_0172317250 /NCGR_PEP_ID=MMETSP1058-20130122/31033_1 /TAXON_ID=83371 /ORGANISM="Detonula confervacea, Strain CCMP 353" /LENGTH=267 /DNA_ID=CAMNT_0013031765 /DNA_START=33 /DNA_END=833 /DNA_ORIENTATION=-